MVGVGGQGVILASDTLAESAMKTGYDVKKSDSIGMAQRGGSVVSHIRLGEAIFSPLIKTGDADFLICFERLEAARWAPYLKEGAVAIVADVVLMPLSVTNTNTPYPDWKTVRDILKQRTDRVYLVPALSISQQVGNPRALNIVMLGCLSSFLDIADDIWIEYIRRKLPKLFLDSSIKAFNKGVAVTNQLTGLATEVGK